MDDQSQHLVIPDLKGFVDGFVEGFVTGWVFDPQNPDVGITVEVFIDGDWVGETIANCYRLDLFEAGIGDGRHQFKLAVNPALIDNKRHSVEVVDKSSKLLVPADTKKFWFHSGPSEQAKHVFHPHDIYKLFDESFYLSQSGRVSVSPIDHYKSVGWIKHFNPHPLFDTKYYCSLIEVDDLRTDPLTHFFNFGQFENARTHPLFDNRLYYKSRPDVLLANKHPVLHYLEIGWTETPFPSVFFSEKYYEANVHGVREAGFAPVIHYLVNGYREGRKPHPDFNPSIFSKCADLNLSEEPLTALVRDILINPKTNNTTPIKISIIILNLQKTLTTLQCIYFLRKHTDLSGVEIIIVDNGSSPENFALLCKYASPCHIIRIGVNRGFGEANNIGVESASGEILVFLNNDAYVTHGWLTILENVLRSSSDIGAVGPRFVYPSGSLQEAGAMIAPDGTAIQRGKHLDPRDPMFNTEQEVDYCSAATLIIWKDLFIQVMGYDLCWDPAYYEDADLSLKLRLLGRKTIYTPKVEIVHVENATSSDQNLDLRLHNVVRANRMKFVARWGRYLAGLPDEIKHDLLPNLSIPASVRPKKTIGLYTPYPLAPGGGERYLLSMAAACKDDFRCSLLTDDRYSRLRLLTLGRELNLDVSHIELALWNEFNLAEPFDVFICMGNEVLPPAHPRGRKNFHHCQFPFPMLDGHYVRDWAKLDGYKGMIVNSHFTARHVMAESMSLGVPIPPVHVVYPAVPQVKWSDGMQQDRGTEKIQILHVGRFAPGGHCKRQDVMIEVFRQLTRQVNTPIELHLAGALGGGSGDREYLLSLQDAARGLRVSFHVNISVRKLHNLYRDCSIYWHITGMANDVTLEPEKFEHFGITIVEAMSAGLIPVVLRHGGPSEIITDGEDGFLIGTVDELREKTHGIITMSKKELMDLRSNAVRKSIEFRFDSFKSKLHSLLDGL